MKIKKLPKSSQSHRSLMSGMLTDFRIPEHPKNPTNKQKGFFDAHFRASSGVFVNFFASQPAMSRTRWRTCHLVHGS